MATTLLRRVAYTRYIFLLSGVAFVLWTLAISLAPKSFILSALFQTDIDHTAERMANLHFSDPTRSSTHPRPGGIGIARAHIFVVSLADRQDRRDQMAFLRAAQGLTWTVVDAVPNNATHIDRILDRVALQRASAAPTANVTGFRWPEEIEALSVSSDALQPSGSDTWIEPPRPAHVRRPTLLPPRPTLVCAAEDDTVPTFTNGTPAWMVLSPAKVACWHSHVLAIRRFVAHDLDSDAPRRSDDVAVILEDDIDMEKDIADRLAALWPSLPAGWDILFLGHCWSDEGYYAPLANVSGAALHPSRAPKCTHAYALSRPGARRLLQHLRYPPFAYSRALDQAYAWLVRSGRLRSYSIVPSVVVQRKRGRSDILPGSGSEWRQGLREGVFEA